MIIGDLIKHLIDELSEFQIEWNWNSELNYSGYYHGKHLISDEYYIIYTIEILNQSKMICTDIQFVYNTQEGKTKSICHLYVDKTISELSEPDALNDFKDLIDDINERRNELVF